MQRTAGIFVFAFALTGCLAEFGQNPVGEAKVRAMESPHYRKDRFINTRAVDQSFSPLKLGRVLADIANNVGDQDPSGPVPVRALSASTLGRPPARGMRLAWMGHSAYLIEIDGFRVLTDPIWSDRASPVGFTGPKRIYQAPIALEDLPPIDAVLISHDHYDHLDRRTVETLAKLNAKTRFVVPLGVGSHFLRWGIDRVEELDWWQSVTLRRGDDSLKLVATPARHFSGRGPFERNKTLWASWAVVGPEHRLYFGGDTGYFDGFAEIGKFYGPFDVTLMPVGAYSVNWPDVHINPDEAMTAHLEVGGKLMLPIHWGTYVLGAHAWDEPVEWLLDNYSELDTTTRQDVTLRVPRPGELIDVDDLPAMSTWWRAIAPKRDDG